MKTAVRCLMWAHYIYLLLLPTLAVVAAAMMFPESDFWMQLTTFGFPAVLMYSLFLANGYAIPDSLPIALIVVLLVPIQILLNVLIFGGGSVWLFFAESAAVEVGSFVFGVLTVAMMRRKRETGIAEFGFLLALVLVLFFLGTLPLLISVFFGYGGWSPWLIIFLAAFATGYWEYAKVYRNVGMQYDKSGESQNLEMKFDGGILSRLMGLERQVPLVSPTLRVTDGKQIASRVFVFGFVATFLPVAAAIVLGVVFMP